MNIFMPEITCGNSVQTLDDRRLIKQILECRQIVEANRRIKAGETKVGWASHPVVRFYRDKEAFVLFYGLSACYEYSYRFDKHHAYEEWFNKEYYGHHWLGLDYNIIYCEKRDGGLYEAKIEYDYTDTDEPNRIHREFRDKLIKKWGNDKSSPKWTNRHRPTWYENKE